MIINYLSQFPKEWNSYTIVPIPLSPRRERMRGFNQSFLIAKTVGTHFDLPVVAGLTRTKHTAPQSELENYKDRRQNIKDCFAGNPKLLEGKKIILIDDVATSGATFGEAANALKNAGATGICAVAAALAQ